MSRLRLYWPDEPSRCSRPQVADDESAIVPFRAANRLPEPGPTDSLTRARLLHQNRLCPDCGHPVVEPLVLGDAILDRSDLPIPGTGTLVGFHCHGCESEWPIRSREFAFRTEKLYAGTALRIARDA